MITDLYKLRPRYNEVDKMGYVYHANYVSYCHQARTELMRKMGICDHFLEENNIMLPVISMNLSYKNPAHYDEILYIRTCVTEIPLTRLKFSFVVTNKNNDLICKADTTLVFVDMETRKPMKVPEFIEDVFKKQFEALPI